MQTNETFEIQPHFESDQNETGLNLHFVKESLYNDVPTETKKNIKKYFYVETLLVTDCSVFSYHRDLLQTKNTAIILQHMRLYFTKLMNLVNRKYELALQNDEDISISIQLKDMLFLRVNLIKGLKEKLKVHIF